MGCCSSKKPEYAYIARLREVFEKLFDMMYTIDGGRFAKKRQRGKRNKLTATAQDTMIQAAKNTHDTTFETLNNALNDVWKDDKVRCIARETFVEKCVIGMLALWSETFSVFTDIMMAISQGQDIPDEFIDQVCEEKRQVMTSFGKVDMDTLTGKFETLWEVFETAHWANPDPGCCCNGAAWLQKGAMSVWVEYGQRYNISLFLDFVKQFGSVCPSQGIQEEAFVNFAGEWAAKKIIASAAAMKSAIEERIMLTSSTKGTDYVQGDLKEFDLKAMKAEKKEIFSLNVCDQNPNKSKAPVPPVNAHGKRSPTTKAPATPPTAFAAPTAPPSSVYSTTTTTYTHTNSAPPTMGEPGIPEFTPGMYHLKVDQNIYQPINSNSIVGQLKKGETVEILKFKTLDTFLWALTERGWIYAKNVATQQTWIEAK